MVVVVNSSVNGYYSGIKMNEVLIHATTQKNFENITLLTRSRSQKEHIWNYSIYIKCSE